MRFDDAGARTRAGVGAGITGFFVAALTPAFVAVNKSGLERAPFTSAIEVIAVAAPGAA